MKLKVLISANSAWNLYNFRGTIISELNRAGYEVVAVALPDQYVERLEGIGCRFVGLKIDGGGLNPSNDIKLFKRYLNIISAELPCVFLGYTIKPNVYGSLAAKILGVPVINNISGLGSIFLRGGWLMYLGKFFYRVGLYGSKRVFFQNKDDLDLFLKLGITRIEAADLIPGSGVNLMRYIVTPLPNKKVIRFLFFGRILWDKGVGEIVEAVRILKKRGFIFEMCFVGPLDVDNPSAINQSKMAEWVREGLVNYLGQSDDVRCDISLADCVVLPSYREGTPRSLLEAAAMGRPIIASDAVGCRNVVDDGITGYLVRVKDSIDLASKMEKFLSLLQSERVIMGCQGRAKMEREYDEKIVVNKYIDAVSIYKKNN